MTAEAKKQVGGFFKRRRRSAAEIAGIKADLRGRDVTWTRWHVPLWRAGVNVPPKLLLGFFRFILCEFWGYACTLAIIVAIRAIFAAVPAPCKWRQAASADRAWWDACWQGGAYAELF